MSEEKDAYQPELQLPPPWGPAGSLMHSRISQLDDLLIEQLEQAFHKPTSSVILHDVVKIASEHDPIDLAYAASRLPTYARPVIYDNLPDETSKVIFMINTDRSTRNAIFRTINDETICELASKMPIDEAVWILDDLSDRRLRRIIEMTEPRRAEKIEKLLALDRNSAARMMSNEFFIFSIHAKIESIAEAIRNNPGIDLTRCIFIHNDLKVLVGFVPARNLIINPATTPIRQIMQPIVHKVYPTTSRDEVVDLVERYKISALPVVDERDEMLGVITFETVVESMEEIADETIASIAGTTEDVGEREPIFKRFLGRAPWLCVTLCAGLITASAMEHFTNRAWFIAVPPFVTLIAGMSGNVGIQCSSVLVRGISTGDLSLSERGSVIAKEFLIGLLIGVAFGILCGSVVFLLNQLEIHQIGTSATAVAVTVGCGVLGACLTATSFGTFFPFFFARIGIDPIVAAGPLVTAFNDLTSTMIYFVIAKCVYGYLT